MISSLLHLVGLRPRVYYTLTNFRGGGARPPWPPPSIHQCGYSVFLDYQVSPNHNNNDASFLYQIPANHLLSASIMAAPAALAYSKLSYPETEESKTTSKDVVKMMDAYVPIKLYKQSCSCTRKLSLENTE